MNVSEYDMEVLLKYICHCNDIFDETMKKKIESVLKNRLEVAKAIAGDSEIDEEYLISDIFTFIGTTYCYYEGIKRRFGFRNFLGHVKRREILAVFAGLNINKILKIQNETRTKKSFFEIRYKNKEYFVNDQRISKRTLEKLYFNDKRIISNACFVLDKIEEEKIKINIVRNMEFERKLE